MKNDAFWDDKERVQKMSDDEIRVEVLKYYSDSELEETRQKDTAKVLTTYPLDKWDKKDTDWKNKWETKKEEIDTKEEDVPMEIAFKGVSDVKERITGDFDFLDNVIITKNCYLKILAHVRMLGHEGMEIGGLLKIKHISNVNIVYDMLVLDQVVSTAHFTFDDSTLTEWFVKNAEDKKINEVWGWWHSHHNMGRFWSCTDNTAFEQLSLRMGVSPRQCLGLVFTMDGKFLTKYVVNTPVGLISANGFEVKVGIPSEKGISPKKWEAVYKKYWQLARPIVKKKVTKEIYITKGTKVYYTDPVKDDSKLDEIGTERNYDQDDYEDFYKAGGVDPYDKSWLSEDKKMELSSRKRILENNLREDKFDYY